MYASSTMTNSQTIAIDQQCCDCRFRNRFVQHLQKISFLEHKLLLQFVCFYNDYQSIHKLAFFTKSSLTNELSLKECNAINIKCPSTDNEKRDSARHLQVNDNEQMRIKMTYLGQQHCTSQSEGKHVWFTVNKL